jgi:predicted RNA-binding Zn-ribbon protein involved in translation (DUF1610 family)
MDDLIDRRASIDALHNVLADYIPYLFGINEEIPLRCAAAIRDLPPAEKRGKWERHWRRPNVYADLYWHCSACGEGVEMQWAHIYYKYCPYCGARMERGTDE